MSLNCYIKVLFWSTSTYLTGALDARMTYTRGNIPSAEIFWYSSPSIVVHQFLNPKVFGSVFFRNFTSSASSVLDLVTTICCMNLLKLRMEYWSRVSSNVTSYLTPLLERKLMASAMQSNAWTVINTQSTQLDAVTDSLWSVFNVSLLRFSNALVELIPSMSKSSLRLGLCSIQKSRELPWPPFVHPLCFSEIMKK